MLLCIPSLINEGLLRPAAKSLSLIATKLPPSAATLGEFGKFKNR